MYFTNTSQMKNGLSNTLLGDECEIFQCGSLKVSALNGAQLLRSRPCGGCFVRAYCRAIQRVMGS